MSAMYFRPVVTYPTRCVAPTFFTRPAPVSHQIVPLFSLLDESLTQLDSHLRQAQRQFKRPFNPKFDVKETKGAYSLEGELPGFDAKDISIEFLDDGHTLQIKGKSLREVKKGDAAAVAPTPAANAVADTPATKTSTETAEASTSETGSVKSHQATVEDEVEEPANASATTTEQAATEAPQTTEQSQQVTEQPKKPEEQQQQQPETTNWISERYTGSFTRSFKFPGKIDQEAVRASLKDGILAVTLPLARRPESRKIRIE